MNLKEKLTNYLGTFGMALYYLISLMIAIFPILMLDLPFYIDSLFILIMLFMPSTSIIFWIIGLIGAIMGPQDVFAVIYYVLFVALCVPRVISIFAILFSKRT